MSYMNELNKYKTKQRVAILDFIESNKDREVTANDILVYLNKNDLKASQTTIYRYLDNLVKEGIIKKNYSEEKSSSCYQYVGKRCKEHYHLKCNNCGEIIHLDSEIFSSIEKKIIDRYGFKIDNIKTILYGTCNKCNMNNKSK